MNNELSRRYSTPPFSKVDVQKVQCSSPRTSFANGGCMTSPILRSITAPPKQFVPHPHDTNLKCPAKLGGCLAASRSEVRKRRSSAEVSLSVADGPVHVSLTEK